MVSELLSKKCRYALRALFDLAQRSPAGPFSAQDIAAEQQIPLRFLQLILVELKHSGFVESVRGNEGGYVLSRSPDMITVGEVVRSLDANGNKADSQAWAVRGAAGDYAFSNLWRQAENVLSSLLNTVTFADLVEQDKKLRQNYISDYAI